MKLRKYRFYIYFILFIFTLISAILIATLGNKAPAKISKGYIQSINRKITDQISRLEKKKERLIEQCQRQGDVSLYLSEEFKDYDYYIFQRGKMVFWSSYRIVPTYQDLRGEYKNKFLELSTGKFVISHSKFVLTPERADSLEIFAVLPIYFQYKIDNAYVKSGYNPKIIDDPALEVIVEEGLGQLSVAASDGQYLFDVRFTPTGEQEQKVRIGWAWFLATLSFLFLFFCIQHLVGLLEDRKHFELGFLLWLLFLVLARAFMLIFHFPSAFLDWALFDPRLYASSFISPSVGDLLLNLGVIGFLVNYLLAHYPRSRTHIFILHASPQIKLVISGILVILSYFTLQGFFYVLTTIFLHSKLNLDITRNMDLSLSSLNAASIFIGASITFFFTAHLFGRLFIQLNSEKDSKTLFVFVIASFGYLVIARLVEDFYVLVFLMHALYFGVLFLSEMPKQLYKFKYISFIYLFTGAVLCAMVGTYAIYSFGKKKSVSEKRKFANHLLPETDDFAEFLLGKAIQDIQEDSEIQSTFTDPNITINQVRQKIKKVYLNNYFDKYQVEVLFFNSRDSEPIEPIRTKFESRYSSYEEKYRKIYYETDNENIFFINSTGSNLIKRYLAFIEIEYPGPEDGHIIIDLKQKKAMPTNVYPELLLDKNYIQSPQTKSYSYAFYEDNQLVYSLGTFNYEKNFRPEFFRDEKLYIDGINFLDHEHLAVEGGFKKRVIVSSRKYSVNDIFSNFSFLFLLLIACIVSYIVIYIISQSLRGVKVNFATRIQFYLNLAFFLPLVTISVTIVSILSRTYQKDFNQAFIAKTESVAANILSPLENYQVSKATDQIAKEKLLNILSEIAQYVEVDINAFDAEGNLIASSQPAIYETNLLSQHINPQALYSIQEEKNNQIMLRESVGELRYQTVYTAIKSYETNELLGIVSIPFFEAQYELDKQLIDVLSTIINIFATIFIIFIVLSYFASQILTVPLRLITQKIRKTTFHHYNEPLEWNSKDEIGLFVEEYNKMLEKLDRSKEALVRSQKESAWREIAQQVAHEIKNPLTPMKLTLQYMQQRLQNQGDTIKNTFERPFETLLTQVETLSDIATSFSTFAKMPVPISERFEIAAVLRDSYSLYVNEDIDLNLAVKPGKYYVRGDRRLMGRIVTNLIKNAIEAVPEGRRAKIGISLDSNVEGLVILEFSDNGSGVPKEIQDKIFMPNFSTKSTGSGIGLAVAKRGIEHAGGRIWCESQEGEGTKFFIELPLIE